MPTSAERMRTAVDSVLNGMLVTDASVLHKIPYGSLKRKVGMARKGLSISNKRRGPTPVLPLEIECDLVDWIIGHQLEGFPVTRADVIVKGTKLLNVVQEGTLTDGWYKRFADRHPELVERQAQVVCRVRNQVSDDVVVATYEAVLGAIKSHGLDSSRVYNVDETSFYTRRRSTRVIALKGSRNVWTHDTPPSFHLTIVACGNAAGEYIALTFVLAGQRLQRSLWGSLSVREAQITTTATGFMTSSLFLKWLSRFNELVPVSVQRPVLLLMDGCSSHYSNAIIHGALKMGILLLCLPANATHLFQPLDVAVFAPFKKAIKERLRMYVCEHRFITMTKEAALTIGCESWNEIVSKKHIEAGLRTAGLFPPSLDAMRSRLRLYQDNGVQGKATKASWLQHRERLRADVLLLPPKQTGQKRKRKTIDVAGRLLTVALLEEIEAQEAAATKAKEAAKAVQAKKRRVSTRRPTQEAVV